MSTVVGGLWEHGDCYIRAWGWGEPRGLGFLPGPARAHALTGMCAHLPRMNILACHSLAWNGLPHLTAIIIPSKRWSCLTCSQKPCQRLCLSPATPAPKGVKIVLPTGIGMGTRGVWPEGVGYVAWSISAVLSTRTAMVHSVRRCLFHEALESRVRICGVKNDPSASLTRRPRADQHGSCH